MPSFRITAIFPELEDQHLPKEVVQIPSKLGSYLNAETRSVGLDQGATLEQKGTMAPSMEFEVLKGKKRFFFVERSLIAYLFQHARKTDLLILYHFHKRSYFLALLYKLLNPKGRIYLKGDVYNQRLADGTATHSRRAILRPLLRSLERKALRAIDLISVENEGALRIFKERFPSFAQKGIQLPSGIDPSYIEAMVPNPLPVDERPYRILVVGRIGLYVKGHDLLLKALEGIDLRGAEIRFIGPEAKGFEEVKRPFFQKRPDLQERIRFCGPITDRKKLFEEYAQARFLCLPSRAESFGLVLLEAGAFGVYPIGTDAIESFDEITMNGRFGTKVPQEDPEALRKALQAHIDDPKAHHREAEAYSEHIKRNFDWDKLTEKLYQELSRRKGGLPDPSAQGSR